MWPLPLTMAGRLERCVLISLRTPAEAIRSLLPPPLEPITRRAGGETWAFWNIVVCRIEQMRPAWLPAALGVSYHHAAYRLLAQAPTFGGCTEGLFFLRSDADHSPLCWAGNRFSDLRFHRATVELSREPALAHVVAHDGRAALELEATTPGTSSLASGSIFESEDEAMRALKYPPRALAPHRDRRRVRVTEVARDEAAWSEQPLAVQRFRCSYFRSLGVPDPDLELATWLAPIDYRWRLDSGAAAACSGDGTNDEGPAARAEDTDAS